MFEYICRDVMNAGCITQVSGEMVRGKSKGYSKWKIFYPHLHSETLFSHGEIQVCLVIERAGLSWYSYLLVKL